VEFLDIADFDAARAGHASTRRLTTCDQAGDLRLCAREAMSLLKRGLDQRRVSGPDRHAALRSEQGDVARFGPTTRRGVASTPRPRSSSVPARVPVQRRGVGDQRTTVISDAGYLSSGIHRVVSRGYPGCQVLLLRPEHSGDRHDRLATVDRDQCCPCGTSSSRSSVRGDAFEVCTGFFYSACSRTAPNAVVSRLKHVMPRRTDPRLATRKTRRHHRVPDERLLEVPHGQPDLSRRWPVDRDGSPECSGSRGRTWNRVAAGKTR